MHLESNQRVRHWSDSLPVQAIKWLSQLLRTPLSALGTLGVVFFVLVAIFGDQLAPFNFDENAFNNNDLYPPYKAPDCFGDGAIHVPIVDYHTRLFDPLNAECKNPFGTDKLGYDVYSRVILGTREIFRLAGLGTLVAVLIGTTIGLFIGYWGGWPDEIVSRLLDSLLSIPALLLALILLGTLPESATLPVIDYHLPLLKNSILIVLVVVYSPIVARVVRSNVLSVKTQGFVEAAQLRGESTFYILWREILPSVIPALVVEASLRFSYAIFLVASLGFLSLGANPPTPNWGLMVNDAYNNQDYICNEFQCYDWTLIYPAAAIVLLVISVNLMSDGIKRLVQRSG
ncbi:MAG: ABC transporter permease [Anaerolineales bacterium]|nr:ABC transporter permease [Anaerolineales bacterium]